MNAYEQMREALREIATIDIGNFQEPIDGDSSAIYQNAKYDDKGRVFKGKEIPAFYGAIWYRNLKMAVDKAKAAIAIPLRNCDVGTAYEQSVRMARFCKKQYEKRDDVAAHICSACKFHNSESDCVFEWAQMPYTESGVGE